MLSQVEVLQAAWGDLECGEDQVKLYVSYLRRSFAPSGVDPVDTARGVGYRYRPPGGPGSRPATGGPTAGTGTAVSRITTRSP